MNYIDKLAYIRVEDKRILITRSYGKDVYYIPGGKRDGNETDHEALSREVLEELSVELIAETITPIGVFEAPAHGKAEGTVVRMTCYGADYVGELEPGHEIEEIGWFDYARRDDTSPVDQIIFDTLRERGEL